VVAEAALQFLQQVLGL